MENARKLQVAIPLFDEITVLDAIGPYEVLQMVPEVEVVFVSHKPGACKDLKGFLSLNATASFEDVPKPDIVVVPGGIGVYKLLEDRPLLDWLKQVHETSLYTTSVCTGSLLLGAAGLLKDVKANTHWTQLDELASFGAIPTSTRVVQEGKIITAAGVSSGIDMALQLVALIWTENVAKIVQLMIEYDPQPPFDCGSVEKAGPEIVEQVKSFVNAVQAEVKNS